MSDYGPTLRYAIRRLHEVRVKVRNEECTSLLDGALDLMLRDYETLCGDRGKTRVQQRDPLGRYSMRCRP